ncbi:hypothetical protein [Psychrosphaera algicola]|uniref:Phage shock protein B n=1 Tax=Psychrosphaera algicola TaxID=3023714 RepID=A0ABT5FBG6_9GAMM|nr:hypothetical protein [Psychrosphaera sp. G1-22]MDC2888884.1 hypothetical protein [Psychrosphaera sp. G1-22]
MPISVLTIVLVSVIGGLLYAAYEQHVKLQISKNNNQQDSETQQQMAALKNELKSLKKL